MTTKKAGEHTQKPNYFRKGYTAFEKRTHKRKECPYGVGTNESIQWHQGWDAAQDDAAEEWAMEQVRRNK